jgi:hypothetical protein
MGYALMFGRCIGCNHPLGFNPLHVPSIRHNGVREPVCRTCIERANPHRRAAGLPEFTIHPDAYEPVEESEL